MYGYRVPYTVRIRPVLARTSPYLLASSSIPRGRAPRGATRAAGATAAAAIAAYKKAQLEQRRPEPLVLYSNDTKASRRVIMQRSTAHQLPAATGGGGLVVYRTPTHPFFWLPGDTVDPGTLSEKAVFFFPDEYDLSLLRSAKSYRIRKEPRLVRLSHIFPFDDDLPPGATLLHSEPAGAGMDTDAGTDIALVPGGDNTSTGTLTSGDVFRDATAILSGVDPEYSNIPTRWRLKLTKAEDPDDIGALFSAKLAGTLRQPAPTHRRLGSESIKGVESTVQQYIGFLVNGTGIDVQQAGDPEVLADARNLARFIFSRMKVLSRTTLRTCVNHLQHLVMGLKSMEVFGYPGYAAVDLPGHTTYDEVEAFLRSECSRMACWLNLGPRQGARPVFSTTVGQWEKLVTEIKAQIDCDIKTIPFRKLRDILILGLSGCLAAPLRGAIVCSLRRPDAPGPCLVPGCVDTSCPGNQLERVGGDGSGGDTYGMRLGHYKNLTEQSQRSGPRILPPEALGQRLALVLREYLARPEMTRITVPTLLTSHGGARISLSGGAESWSTQVQAASSALTRGEFSFTGADSRFLFVRSVESRISSAGLSGDEADRRRSHLADLMVSSLDAWKSTYSRGAEYSVRGDSEANRLAFGDD